MPHSRGLLLIAAAALTITVMSFSSACASESVNVADRFAAAHNAGDTQSILLLFTDDAAVVDPGGQMWLGQVQIRGWLGEAHGPAFRRQLEGVREAGVHTVRWIDQVSDVGYQELRMETRAVISGGRIRHLSYRYLFGQREAVQGPATSTTRLIWSLPLLLVAGLVLWPTRVAPGPPPVRREMLAALRAWRLRGAGQYRPSERRPVHAV